MDKISCITVTRNRLEYLKKSIQHYQNQTYTNKELVIIYYDDDKETSEYLENTVLDKSIRYYKVYPDTGLYLGAVRNVGISKCKGEWVCVWDDDDYYAPTRLEEQYKHCIDNNLDAVTLQNLILYSIKHNEVRITHSRSLGWEGSLLCKTDVFPKYSNLKRKEDTPVLNTLYNLVEFGTMFAPELYVYILHNDNTSGATHIEQLFDNSVPLSFKKSREIKNLIGWI